MSAPGEEHAQAIRDALPGLVRERFLGEPTGRDTLNAVGFAAAVIAREDPEATIGVFTADHLIRAGRSIPAIVAEGFALAERRPQTLVTFGVAPTRAATSYGYLQLGGVDRRLRPGRRAVQGEAGPGDGDEVYLAAGPTRYLWNSGMFVWRAATLLDCIRPLCAREFARGLGEDRPRPGAPRRGRPCWPRSIPTLKKISVDFAVMEPASRDPRGARRRDPDAAAMARCRLVAGVRRDLSAR